LTTFGSWAKVMETRPASPRTGSAVRVKGAPGIKSTGSSTRSPIRILGPGRSAIMASRSPVFRATWRRLAMTFRWVSKEPWEKFKRATFMPARIICSMVSTDSDAGPMVQTILVLLSGNVMENLPNDLV
jgi:hypothetical protein